MAARSTARTRIGVGVLLVLAFGLAVLAGAAVLLGVARISASPPVFVLSGLLGFLLVLAAGVWFATRRLAGSRRRVRVLGLVGGVALALVLFVPTTFVSTPAVAPDPVRGQRFWDLPTGSRLAYVEVPGRGERRSTPVVFVHGGPGTPDMEGDRDYVGRLAESGFDVYVYDALGSGRSTRLARPQDYSIERDIADLEAIREAIGAERLNLIGHSYGANVVAGYLATHPANVERVVFSSPGSLDPRDASGALATSRLDSDRRARLYAALLSPRNLLAYGLLQVNPDAAHAFATDGEMDTRLDEIYAISEPGLHCRGGLPADELPRGLGFYRLQ
ncbi:MAG TPA: alpha/beta hydrolase, partial [Actinopolymorphaceae bacterium]